MTLNNIVCSGVELKTRNDFSSGCQSSSFGTQDYEHFPWPWIDLPSTNNAMDWELGWWLGKTFDHEGTEEDVEEEEDFLESCSTQNSPLHHSSPFVMSTASASISSTRNNSFCFSSTRSKSSCGSGCTSVNLTLEAWPIPVLSPLGLHRVRGGERILSGGGVDHMNLIQLIGNPAHEFQPTIVNNYPNSSTVAESGSSTSLWWQQLQQSNNPQQLSMKSSPPLSPSSNNSHGNTGPSSPQSTTALFQTLAPMSNSNNNKKV